MRTSDDAMRWVWRGSAIAIVLIGWIFIFVHNNGHLTPPVVFVGLGYLAGVATIYTLFRTGASAVAKHDDEDGDAWGLPLGKRGELEREKRTLLKAIKEAEFDHQMGKLSKADVEDMVRQYRGRAIEVIKLLEDPGTKQGGTARQQIEREIRARLEVEGAGRNRKNKAKATAAAQTAARAAAASGATGQVAAAMAAAAAARTDDDDDIDDAGLVDQSESLIVRPGSDRFREVADPEPLEPETAAASADSADVKSSATSKLSDATATDTSDVEPRARDKEASR